jgi:hypothetical protein
MLKNGLSKNTPEILREWARPLPARQRRRFAMARHALGREIRPISIGPLTRAHIRAFGAKLACALHYTESGQILPRSGGIAVTMRFFGQTLLDGPFPLEFLSLLDPVRTLMQGKHEVSDQFRWASKWVESSSVHWVDLSGSLELALLVSDDAEVLARTNGKPFRIFHPGAFTSPLEIGFFPTISISWRQEL